MLVPYIRDLVRETKQLNFLTAHVCMHHAIFKVLYKQQYSDFPIRCQNISRMLSGVWLFKLPKGAHCQPNDSLLNA